MIFLVNAFFSSLDSCREPRSDAGVAIPRVCSPAIASGICFVICDEGFQVYEGLERILGDLRVPDPQLDLFGGMGVEVII
ncbi:hypothetical protein ZIOFF_029317 [Zingiber officinale]|uniref:Uncharacterized protein n=1 Tax=Zingiber officinale TaxID=94328 RepID=A0A8J5H7Y8_ZINOF|nr:hypothetical protein ZIOFF_029317 [Zingiber officinale]